jgi:hypothetical protein
MPGVQDVRPDRGACRELVGVGDRLRDRDVTDVGGRDLLVELTARYLRIVAVKPDGGGQTGGQMAISELAVYGS